jgi:hypothetical protein
LLWRTNDSRQHQELTQSQHLPFLFEPGRHAGR